MSDNNRPWIVGPISAGIGGAIGLVSGYLIKADQQPATVYVERSPASLNEVEQPRPKEEEEEKVVVLRQKKWAELIKLVNDAELRVTPGSKSDSPPQR